MVRQQHFIGCESTFLTRFVAWPGRAVARFLSFLPSFGGNWECSDVNVIRRDESRTR